MAQNVNYYPPAARRGSTIKTIISWCKLRRPKRTQRPRKYPNRVRAGYSYRKDKQVVLIYEDQPMVTLSVTNDAENVIQDLVEAGIDVDRSRIIYLDGQGHWDGLATEDGAFSGFVMLGGVTDEAEAIETALAHPTWLPARKEDLEQIIGNATTGVDAVARLASNVFRGQATDLELSKIRSRMIDLVAIFERELDRRAASARRRQQ